MELCKLCTKEFANLGVHLRKKHGISREEHDLRFSDDTELTDELTDNAQGIVDDIINGSANNPDAVTAVELTKNRFESEEKDPDRPLSVFLQEFSMTEKELRALIRQYKGEDTVPVAQTMMENEKRAKIEAVGYIQRYESEGMKTIDVPDSWTSDHMVKQCGFECIETKRNPKRWVLRKL